MEKKISVILPVYNVADYLEECLSSVCAQTYACLEILLIDDGSTDGTSLLCDQWAARDSRIRVLHKKNAGLGAARNDGLRLAEGQLITYLDGDDWLEPDAYQAMIRAMEQHGVDLVFTGRMDTVDSETECFRGEEASAHLLQGSRPVGWMVWNKLYTAELAKKYAFPEDQTVGEDQMYTARVLMECGRCVWINRTVYHYRYRPNSLSNGTDPVIILKDNQKCKNQRIAYYRQEGKESLVRLCQWEMLRTALNDAMFVARNPMYSASQKRRGTAYLQQIARQLPPDLGRTPKERFQHFFLKQNAGLYQMVVGVYWKLGDRLRKREGGKPL